MTKETIFQEAERIIVGDRQEDYGPLRKSFERIAEMWSVILERMVTVEQVGLCMIAFKLCRQCHRAKRDNLVDVAGYARILEMLADDAQEPTP